MSNDVDLVSSLSAIDLIGFNGFIPNKSMSGSTEDACSIISLTATGDLAPIADIRRDPSE